MTPDEYKQNKARIQRLGKALKRERDAMSTIRDTLKEQVKEAKELFLEADHSVLLLDQVIAGLEKSDEN